MNLISIILGLSLLGKFSSEKSIFLEKRIQRVEEIEFLLCLARGSDCDEEVIDNYRNLQKILRNFNTVVTIKREKLLLKEIVLENHKVSKNLKWRKFSLFVFWFYIFLTIFIILRYKRWISRRK